MRIEVDDDQMHVRRRRRSALRVADQLLVVDRMEAQAPVAVQRRVVAADRDSSAR